MCGWGQAAWPWLSTMRAWPWLKPPTTSCQVPISFPSGFVTLFPPQKNGFYEAYLSIFIHIYHYLPLFINFQWSLYHYLPFLSISTIIHYLPFLPSFISIPTTLPIGLWSSSMGDPRNTCQDCAFPFLWALPCARGNLSPVMGEIARQSGYMWCKNVKYWEDRSISKLYDIWSLPLSKPMFSTRKSPGKPVFLVFEHMGGFWGLWFFLITNSWGTCGSD